MDQKKPIRHDHSQSVHFRASWPSDPAAGLWGGSEEVTIAFKDGWEGGIPEDTVEFLKQSLSDMWDGADVEVIK